MKLGIYEHFKENKYKAIAIVKHSETQEDMVLYQALYEDKGLWVRPRSMFLEEITRDGKTFPRFKFVGLETK